MSEPIEQFWNEILSRQPERVRAAFATLTLEEKQALLTHLERMTSEPGWHTEQTKSARAALKALENIEP